MKDPYVSVRYDYLNQIEEELRSLRSLHPQPISTPTSPTTPNPWLASADRLRVLRLQVESSQSQIGMRHLASLLLVMTDLLMHITGGAALQDTPLRKPSPASSDPEISDQPPVPSSNQSTQKAVVR